MIPRNELCKYYRSWVSTNKGEINCACVDEEKRTITKCDYTESKGCWKCPRKEAKMKILDLPLKAKWYKMIESGVKTEEYREIKPYWEKRLLNYKAIKANARGIAFKKYFFRT